MTRHFIHAILATLLILLTFNGVWFLAVPLFFWYVFSYPAYELIFAAIAIDVYFLPTVGVWWYTVIVATIVTLSAFVRPRRHREYGFYD